MAGVKHTYSTSIADDPAAEAAGMVLPSHWNADHTLSGVADQTSLDAVSAAVAVLSAAHTSLAGSVAGALSAIAANSAQMTSADNNLSVFIVTRANAVSAAVAVVSAAHTSLVSDVGRISVAVSANTSGIAANSAQMTSADNAISAAVAVVSAAHTSLAGSVAGALSAIAANSAQMTSADDAISAAVNVVSLAHVSLVSDVGRISAAVSSLGPSGDMTRILADNQVVGGTAPVSLSGFTFTCSAGVGYTFELNIYTSSPTSLAAPKFILSAPGTPTRFYANFLQLAGPAFPGSNVVSSDSTVAFTTVSAVGVTRLNRIIGSFVASTAGTFALAVGNAITGSTAGSSITFIAGSHGFLWRAG